jgi:hypothetical protein
MKWIYIFIVLAIAAFTLGCVDKNQAETTTEISTGTPVRAPVSPGESAVTPAAIPSEVSQTPAPGEDIFGTYGDLAAMDNMSSDMDMQIALSNEI